MTIVSFSQELAQQFYTSKEQFPIDFDNAWVWLEYSRKDSAKRTFLSFGFTEGEDFKSFHINVECADGKGSSRRETIKMTCDCLKTWGMMAGTPKGKEIRKYFLECERIAKQSVSSPQVSIPKNLTPEFQQAKQDVLFAQQQYEFWKEQGNVRMMSKWESASSQYTDTYLMLQPQQPVVNGQHYQTFDDC